MSFILDTVVPFVLVYKYWALFLVCFLSSIALPIPATTTLTAMSAFAANGYVDFSWTLIAAFVGYVLGDWLGFWLARTYGPGVVRLKGIKRISEYRYYLEAERYVNKHPGSTIFLSRFVTAAGPVVNVLAGLSAISFKKFLIYDLIGEALDVLLFGLGGYFFGDQFQNYGSTFTIIILVVIIIAFIAYQLFPRHKK